MYSKIFLGGHHFLIYQSVSSQNWLDVTKNVAEVFNLFKELENGPWWSPFFIIYKRVMTKLDVCPTLELCTFHCLLLIFLIKFKTQFFLPVFDQVWANYNFLPQHITSISFIFPIVTLDFT